MNDNIVTYDEFMKGLNEETKLEKFKRKAKAGAKKTADFCKEHWFGILVGTSLALGLVEQGAKTYKACKPNQTDKERDRIDHTYYDPSTGMHWDLRRKATNEDRKKIEERKGTDSMSDILSDLKLI